MRPTRALLLVAFLAITIALCDAAPQSRLQVSANDEPDRQFVEEVKVESTLHVRRPASSGRQSRAGAAQTNLRDGSRVAEAGNKY